MFSFAPLIIIELFTITPQKVLHIDFNIFQSKNNNKKPHKMWFINIQRDSKTYFDLPAEIFVLDTSAVAIFETSSGVNSCPLNLMF